MIYLRFALCYNDAREYSTTFPVAPDPRDKIFRILPPILFITEQLFLFFSHPAENITMTPPSLHPRRLCYATTSQQHSQQPHPLHIRLVNKVQLSFVFYFFFHTDCWERPVMINIKFQPNA